MCTTRPRVRAPVGRWGSCNSVCPLPSGLPKARRGSGSRASYVDDLALFKYQMIPVHLLFQFPNRLQLADRRSLVDVLSEQAHLFTLVICAWELAVTGASSLRPRQG